MAKPVAFCLVLAFTTSAKGVALYIAVCTDNDSLESLAAPGGSLAHNLVLGFGETLRA